MNQRKTTGGVLKNKDLVGIPRRVAVPLQADGWYLRQDIIWHKPNPMPESVTDRCTKAHEYIFLMSKSARYYYDADAIKEPLAGPPHAPGNKKVDASRNDADQMSKIWGADGRRNRRSVWTIATKPYRGAHFATYPPALVEPCILAGTSAKGACPVCGAGWERVTEIIDTEGRLGKGYHDHKDDLVRGQRGVFPAEGAPTHHTTGWRPTCDHDEEPVPCLVLDPFAGSGTTGMVAIKHGREFVGLDLNGDYLHELATERMNKIQKVLL